MKSRVLYSAVAALLLTLPAAAEPMLLAQGAPPAMVSPYEVLTIVRSTGLDPLDRPIRRGPNYVLHAIGRDGREVRVVVSARYGDIVAVTPMASASRLPPGAGPGLRMGPYERMAPEGYIPAEPLPRDVYESGPPVVYEADPPILYAPRPPAAVPNPQPYPRGAPPYPRGAQPLPPGAEPPPVITATPQDGYDERPLSRPPGTVAPGSDSGLLPPPPDRFQQRLAPPAVKPAPVKRAAAGPSRPPLPKPRPEASAGKPESDAAPMPPAIPERKPDTPTIQE